MKGVCGDPDVAFEATHAVGVLPPAASELLPAPEAIAFAEPRVSLRRGRFRSAPDCPPPRS